MNGIQILMYHQVGRFPSVDTHRATYCDVDRFRWQMRYLHVAGYTVLSMTDVLNCVSGTRPIPKKAVALTFDDAYENFYDHALPILQRYGFTATVYAIAGLIGQKADWLAIDGHPTPRLMTAAQLQELITLGIGIGSHGYRHIRLAQEPKEAVLDDAYRSKAVLEQALGQPVEHFCYPYGSHNLETVRAVASAGYRTAVTCDRATAGAGMDPLALPRKAVSWGDSLLGVWWKMHMKNSPKQPLIQRSLAERLGSF